MATKSAPRKSAPRKATARKTTGRKSARQSTAAQSGPATTARVKPAMTAGHKHALAVGREESRAVRRYLEALEAHKPKRGRKRTSETIKARLQQIDNRLATADPLTRVHLVQERLDLQTELSSKDNTVDLAALEEGFVKAARGYGERKHLTYSAWRAAGVDANVLRRAGIPRTRG
jgi:hypothetical protein